MKTPKVRRTERGFARADFKDQYQIECSIQKSSIAGKSCIWFGCNEGNPRVLAFQINGGTPNGWVPLPLPKGVKLEDIVCDTRMHLTQAQVKALLPLLQKFVKTGELL